MSRPQTIQIFLPDGSPTSIKEAELTNRLVKAILFPRNKIQDVAKREGVHYTGVYFLFGNSEDGVKPKVYIGEGEDCFTRILQHNRKKDFWTHCVIMTTKTNEYTKTDGKFLEHYCLKKAEEASRYKTDNDAGSKLPSISESRVHDLLDHFDTIQVLLTTLGFSLFERVDKTGESDSEKFQIKFKDIIALGKYTDEGFVVLKGSEARLEFAPSFRQTQIALREKLIEEGVLSRQKNELVFSQNYLFPSPSAASDMIKGNSSNGWIEWKTAGGRTLDEIKRK